MGIIWEGNPNTGSTLCNDILQDIKNELHSILETVLKTEMYSAYGRDMW